MEREHIAPTRTEMPDTHQNIQDMLDTYIGDKNISEGKSPEEKKFIALYMARRVLSQIGTVAEKLLVTKNLKKMIKR